MRVAALLLGGILGAQALGHQHGGSSVSAVEAHLQAVAQLATHVAKNMGADDQEPKEVLKAGEEDEFLRGQLVLLRDMPYFEHMKGGTSTFLKSLKKEFAAVTEEKVSRFNMLDMRGKYMGSESLLSLRAGKPAKRASNNGPGIAEAETFVDFEINEGKEGMATTRQVLKSLQSALQDGTIGKDMRLQSVFKTAAIEKAAAPSDEDVADATADFPALPAHMPTCAEFREAKPVCRADRNSEQCEDTAFVSKLNTECNNVASDHASCMYGLWQTYGNCCSRSYQEEKSFKSAGECHKPVAVIAALPSCADYKRRGETDTFERKVKEGCGQYEENSQNRCAREVTEIYGHCEKQNGCHVSARNHRDTKFVDCTISELSKRTAVDDDDKKKDDEMNPFAPGFQFSTMAPGQTFAPMDVKGFNATMGPESLEEANPYDEAKKELRWTVLIIWLLLLLCCCGACAGVAWWFTSRKPKGDDSGPVTQTLQSAPVNYGVGAPQIPSSQVVHARAAPDDRRQPTVTTYYESDLARQYDTQQPVNYQIGTGSLGAAR
eukprot:CAMPEP_0204320208 /NCGR_PEP_ID=MMETSP0469-20131031/7528_1 /ASSEMBLY_ACC=CAM_ASM_000384 /TAXON_ID=2969 /ORGANISM="Oxyrrhis marina" /LENGTH=547 /DNA_ID=CAMNT_0051301469 /DNA_START=24 /DNA_END=1667 /DNA_ORIENTATION=-